MMAASSSLVYDECMLTAVHAIENVVLITWYSGMLFHLMGS